MSLKPHTLVILTPGFPANEADTNCLPAQQQFIKALRRSLPALKIIVLALKYPFAASHYEWYGSQVIAFGIRKGFYQKMRWLRVWRMLRKIQKENNVMGMLSFWCTECALIGTYFGRMYSIRHLSWVLGQDARKSNVCVKLMRPRSQELIALSDFLANEFYTNHGVRPQHIIPNGIDTALFRETAPVRDIDLLGAGSLIPLKQYPLFIETAGALVRHFPALSATLCGKGPEEALLKKQIVSLHLEQHVTLTGEMPHPEMLRLMQRTKIFLHPSAYEGFSGACLEALCAGAHVISFHNPMTRHTPHWHIVSSKEEMMQKAKQLLNDPRLDHEPEVVYSIEETARSVMRLFGYYRHLTNKK